MPRRFLSGLLCALLLAACAGGEHDGVVDVAFVGSADQLAETGLRLSAPAQALRAAEAQGLVRFDEAGQIVPGIAERWIVTDDGASYIFRIREFDLPGGGRLTAQAVRDSLLRTRTRLAGTSLGLDLADIADIRAMTGRVVELRLRRPVPGLLQLLAQPELGLAVGNAALGPMRRVAEQRAPGRAPRVLLEAMPPELRGLPSQPEWAEEVQPVAAYAVPAAEAVAGFGEGRFDLVLGGTIADLPLAGAGPLSRGNVRLEPVTGLLGLAVTWPNAFFAEAANREALAMAIDRDALIAPFNIGGWVPSTRLVPASAEPRFGGLPRAGAGAAGDDAGERWTGLTLEQRRARARARVSAWEARSGRALTIRVALPPGPGSDLVFAALRRDFAAIGARTVRARAEETADLTLRDRVARYPGPLWYLNQFSCRAAREVCVPEADARVAEALAAPDPALAAVKLAEAERTLAAANLFIPLGPPIRWSLVRAGTPGFTENAGNIHPLFPLSRAPI